MKIRDIVAAATLLVAGPGLAVAQLTSVGPEFQVNTYTSLSQRYISVAMNGSGNFVVVWSSSGQDGSGSGVFGQRFDRAGARVGSEFQINSYTSKDQTRPSVALDRSGNFVVAWESYGEDGSNDGVFARRFNRAGAPRGSELQVNTYTTDRQIVPSVAVDGSGNFTVAWQSYGQDGSDYGIFGRRFTRAGAPRGSEFQVNTYTTSQQGAPVVAMSESGEFVVAWSSPQKGTGYDETVMAQMFDGSGTPAGGEFQVNTYTGGSQYDSSVAMDPAGNFVVAWTSYGQDGSLRGVFAQPFDSSGGEVGGEIQVNTFTTDRQFAPSVAMDGSGNFVVAWESYGQEGSQSGIFAQQFDGSGAQVGGEFQVNTYTTGYQRNPSIAADGSGNFVVAWTSLGQDGSLDGVFAQRFCAGGDVDGDGICDSQDVVVTTPLDGDTFDCTTATVTPPAIAWDRGGYDKFRVLIASDPNFGPGTGVTSGSTLLGKATYTPPAKVWKGACKKALEANPSAPVLYMKVLGLDVNAFKTDANRQTFSQVVQVEVQ